MRRFEAEGGLRVVDARTLQWQLNEPVGALVTMLGAPYCTQFVMPEEFAVTPSTEAVEELVGTGAYKFGRWEVGNKVVIERFEEYNRRAEPGDNYVGGSIAYIDRIEFLEIPDEQTKISGLLTGEWDVVDGASFDFYDQLNEDPNYVIGLYKPGNPSHFYLNVTIPPFDDVMVRQAFAAVVDVESFMFALGPQALWISCSAMYWCGTPLEVHDGEEFYDEANVERARQLLVDSTYDGRSWVLLNPTDYATITPLGLVAKPVLEEIGFNVDMPAFDWSTVVSKFGSPESFGAVSAWYSHFEGPGPVEDHLISGTVDWLIRDEEMINLVQEFATSPDANRRMEIVRMLNRQRLEKVPNVMLGQFFPITPATAALKNFGVKPIPWYTNAWLER